MNKGRIHSPSFIVSMSRLSVNHSHGLLRVYTRSNLR
ncbi:hypothetical protein [Aeromonas phage JELG-KS1]|uniref:Uncharacterized protein n=1 Tax=Aeromonas phage JELG-KS1 TaxID=2951233 RepID=A0A9E7SYX6_9CAUD|nr:hypothetical protein [Aeromonas phage JELG-KS1]